MKTVRQLRAFLRAPDAWRVRYAIALVGFSYGLLAISYHYPHEQAYYLIADISLVVLSGALAFMTWLRRSARKIQ